MVKDILALGVPTFIRQGGMSIVVIVINNSLGYYGGDIYIAIFDPHRILHTNSIGVVKDPDKQVQKTLELVIVVSINSIDELFAGTNSNPFESTFIAVLKRNRFRY